MDVYVSQLTGSTNHDWFYTNSTVIVSSAWLALIKATSLNMPQAAYKNYVKTFVTRYLNEPGILAWELANEPRCRGSTG